MSGMVSVVDVDMEKLMEMPSKELHQQSSSVVYEAARVLNEKKGNFYSNEILGENPYQAFIVLRNLNL